jgi:hypothetical protein
VTDVRLHPGSGVPAFSHQMAVTTRPSVVMASATRGSRRLAPFE